MLSTNVNNILTATTHPPSLQENEEREAQLSRAPPFLTQPLSLSLCAGSTLPFHLSSTNTLGLVTPTAAHAPAGPRISRHKTRDKCQLRNA